MENASDTARVGRVMAGCSGRPVAVRRKPKLLDQLRRELRSRHYSRRTEQACVVCRPLIRQSQPCLECYAA